MVVTCVASYRHTVSYSETHIWEFVVFKRKMANVLRTFLLIRQLLEFLKGNNKNKEQIEILLVNWLFTWSLQCYVSVPNLAKLQILQGRSGCFQVTCYSKLAFVKYK